MKEIFLIGLGNPGKKYLNNRHNIGFLLLKHFSKKYNSNFLLKDKLKSSCSEFQINDSNFRLFLPNTFMNNSGDAVRAIIDWYKINLDQILIIVDDKDLPLGKIRFRRKGSSGGHNGLKSIIEQFQTQNFKRIRIGIGSPPLIKGKNNFNTISHVLGNISLEEKSILDKVYKKVIDSLEQIDSKKEEFIINELNSFDKDQLWEMRSKPETIANVSVKEYCFSKKQIQGVVEASKFKWTFTWSFNKGQLKVNPPLGRALIEDALLRFLLKKDYELETGHEYKFTISAKF